MAFDIAVVGAGIAGASFAFYAAPHARVLILEREALPGQHSTGRSAAMFMESYGSPQVRALTRASRAFLEAPPAACFGQGPLISPRGALYIGPAGRADELRALRDTLRAEHNPAELLDGAQARALCEVLRPEAAALAVLDPLAADLDVHRLHQGYLRGAKAAGAELHCHAEVQALERRAGLWHIGTPAGAFTARTVVSAAGAWADVLGARAGLAPIGLQPRRRSAFVFEAPPGMATAHWPCIADLDESFYFKPEAGLLLGSPANADPVSPHDVVPEELDIATGIHHIEQATTLTIRRPRRSWAGLRSFVPDGDLVGGFEPHAAPGFFWLAAQGGYGIQTSAAMGELCAALVLQRSAPAWADAALVASLAVRRPQ